MRTTQPAPPADTSTPLPTRSAGLRANLFSSTALILGAITVLGLALRLYRLDARSLWLDEVVTAYVRRYDHINDLFGYLHYWVDNTPLPYLLTWLLRGLDGNEVVLRLPSVVAGTLGIPAIYYLGKTLFRSRVGLLAASLMAVLPFAVWYSQEARAYALLMLFTVLQMLFAYRSVTCSHWYDWLALSAFTIVNLYTHNLALLATLAMSTFVVAALLAQTLRLLAPASPDRVVRRRQQIEAARKLTFALAAALLTALAYLPWLPTLQQFLERRDLGFGLVAGTAPPTLDTLGALLVALDVNPPVLFLVLVGLLTCLVRMRRAPQTPSVLMLIWTLLPLLAFWLSAHEAMLNLASRYYSIIYPAFLLLAALAVNTLAEWLGAKLSSVLSNPTRAPRRTTAVLALFSTLALLLSAQALPALANSYALPKEDYRGVAAFIGSTSQPGAVVLAMGVKATVFFPQSLQYYLDLQHSSIVAVDARTVDFTTAQRLAAQKSDVWAVVYHGPTTAGLQQAQAQGLEVTPFAGMSLVRVLAPGLSPVQQAQALLNWGSASEPKLLTSARLLDAVSGKATLGPNLLPPLTQATADTGQIVLTGTWALPPSAATLSIGGDLTMSANENEANTTVATTEIHVGKSYLLSFRYRNGALDGSQRFYVSAQNGDVWLDTFPDGLGFLCDSTADWKPGGFAFTVPQSTAFVKVWLRVTGEGSAEYEDVALKEIR